LDATSLGRPLYEKLGFEPEYEVARWECALPPATTDASLLRSERESENAARDFQLGPVTADQLPAVVELDRRVTGTDRQRLIGHLCEFLGTAWAVTAGGKLAGYAILRPGFAAIQVGPAVALDAAAGATVFEAALRSCAGHRVFIDIPSDNAVAGRWAESKGLQVQRRWLRMRHGQPVHDYPGQLWASSGPENG
jgi:hypothetical protein